MDVSTNKRVITVIDNNFEDLEFISCIDLLYRAGFSVDIASFDLDIKTGKYQTMIKPHLTIDQININDYCLYFQSGGPQINQMRNNQMLQQLITNAINANMYLAFTCAAPLLLADLNILDDHQFCMYPPLVPKHLMNNYINTTAHIDQHIITGSGINAIMDFNLLVLKAILSEQEYELFMQQNYIKK